MITTRTHGRVRVSRLALIAVTLLVAGATTFAWLSSDDSSTDHTGSAQPGKDAAALDTVNEDTDEAASEWTPPVTNDPTVLARWLAELIYGMDHREDRDTYVEAVSAAGLDSLADDQHAARDLVDEHPDRDPAAQLVPDESLWQRLAEHDQWSSFDVREPIGVQAIDAGAELAAAGVTVTKVLVVGTRTIHYTDANGTSQAHVEQPALGVLIACAPGLDGCRLVRVVEH